MPWRQSDTNGLYPQVDRLIRIFQENQIGSNAGSPNLSEAFSRLNRDESALKNVQATLSRMSDEEIWSWIHDPKVWENPRNVKQKKELAKFLTDLFYDGFYADDEEA